VTCYNQGKFLRQCLESIANQIYKDFEIIFINDGSTDNTIEVFEEFKKDYPKILAFYYYTNDIGATNARHFAISKTNGNFYVPLDADDYIDPKYIEILLPYLEENGDYGFIYCDSIYVFEDNRQQRFYQQDYSFYDLLNNNFISYCSLFRKYAYYTIGSYDLGNTNFYEDYQLYIRLGKKGWYGKHIAEPLFFYRSHKDSSMQSKRCQILSNVYRYYIIAQEPLLFPAKWVEEANKTLSKFPNNFMSYKPKEQEKYLKDREMI
jgi:glycosyltransferase involved in cell wall biosynthesis